MTQTVSEKRSTASAEEFPRTLAWTKFSTALCGVWLAANTGLSDKVTQSLLINDLVCGFLICTLALLSLRPGWDRLRWVTATIGAWLLFSPLIFWAPTAFHFDSSMLIGVFVIAFSFLVPGQPGQKSHPGSDIPPGWTYNPSSWHQRGPLIVIALIGFFLARYLAAYQLGYTNTVWDPFFGNGTERVLESEISRAFIVSDAGLGAVAYLVDALEGFLGRQNRWRTMPWAVILFAASIVPAGVTSVVLVMLQPIGVGAWCSICLFAAVAMLIMVPFAVDELVATCQFLGRSMKRGKPFWRTLMFGGDDVDEQLPESTSAERARKVSIFHGVNFPLTLLASALVGVFVMASPAILGITATAADSQHLTGALVVTIAAAAMAEPCRAVRFLNVLAGVWLIVSPFILLGFPAAMIWLNLTAAAALMVLSLPKGKIHERYGSFDKFVF